MNYPLHFYSTNLQSEKVTFSEALLKGQAPDKGLYMPETLPQFTLEEIKAFAKLEYHEIAYAILSKLLQGDIDLTDLQRLTKNAYDFDVPLEHVYEQKYVMRLDQGPTASFKDFAGRMMGQWMQHYLEKNNQKLLILTATSGDTGSAMANAFFGLDNVKVVVLFPINEVSDRQRKQMTTLGNNISTIAIDGKFDDCQALVKQAFSDRDLDYLNLSSANSINIGRLLPQTVYYFWAFAKLHEQSGSNDIIFAVPSGNFGDMMGGMLAFKMGLPVKKFIIATNENDEVPLFFASKKYNKIEPSKNCLSNAMNVGHPSNLARLVALYGGVMDEKGNISKDPDFAAINKDIEAVSITDDDTKLTIRKAYEKFKLVLEPHGAVGWRGLWNYLIANPLEDSPTQLCVALETAHPAKFPDQIINLLGIDPALPESLTGLEGKEETVVHMQNDYNAFKSFLTNHF